MPYFDHNATTPLATVAREIWLRAQDEAWQNPSSPYRAGAQVKIRLEAAREKFAILLGGEAERYVFTSGATEGANLVLAHWARTLPADALIGLNPTEHPCVLAPALALFGTRVRWLTLDAAGVVDVAALRQSNLLGYSGGRIAAVVVMAANNVTGFLQPWAHIAELCQQAGVAYLCDASQWLGKLPAGGIGGHGFVIASAHKFGGPKGVGLLKLAPQSEGLRGQLGGEQERGHRGGTEDFPAIAAMGAALAEAEQKKVFLETERLRWRDDFERDLTLALPGLRVVAVGADRLWNTVALIMPFGASTRWVTRLDKRGFQISTGAACATGKSGPSPVLAALGFEVDTAQRLVRVSAGWETSELDWGALLGAFIGVAVEVRE
ncbi:MAG: aminotransferase class V-fold PLP-dependent enzyme [Opitutus sp.]|nr:aminotransferase class V-fold PLP-dependent enzyme [Opitutus sp.]MCS6246939.1 aminotransferase class V-fold PLP-dependent enzyme [Opitutus sp.]MCS6273160.1 aminotransferase class V-fold PLP-dependent enzyme [Opitutus sp.]MCS6279065.1 aminotransferase class V-fold PLP-dependent enzyme [Opitutus sp.]MCS6298600.1 aminotransferase class V-fold PLP-dependent enzyme [Opitutus sp.]